MATSASQASQRHEFEHLLSAACGRVHRSAWRAQIPIAGERALRIMVCVAGIYALVCVGSLVTGDPIVIGWTAYGCSLGVALVLPATITMVRAFRLAPSRLEAAERLDLGAGDHNRVAIGLSLARCAEPSPFACAAIDDGLASLRRIRDEAPQVDRSQPPWRRLMVAGAMVLGLTLVAGLCGAVSQSSAFEQRGARADATMASARHPAGGRAPRPLKPTTSPAPKPPDTPAGRSHATETALAAKLPAKSRGDRAAGRTRTGISGPTKSIAQSARAGGEPSSASASSAKRENDKKRRRPSKDADRKKTDDSRKPAAHAESSATSAGSSGGGSPSPVHHDWAQRAQASGDDRAEDERQEDVEDERESSTQRGGIQPSLKDRQEAPSRELGISGEQGPPGTGRGGPTPPKKSRGTASLVLGVPVPDFVKGRLGPGTTKITRQRAQPSTIPGDPTTPVAARPRALPEAPCPGFDTPPDLVVIVRNYLVALHSADARASAKSGRSAASAPGLSEE